MKKKLIATFTLSVLLFIFVHPIMGNDYYITKYGAKTTNNINTSYINAAIVACNKNGGGRVVVPTGTFRTGTVVMKSNVQLFLESGATLLASEHSKDLPLQPLPNYKSQKDAGGWRALIYAEGVSDIAIMGFGTIDGNGAKQTSYPGNTNPPDLDGRPRNIVFISCNNIRVEGVRIINSGMWAHHYLDCENVTVDKVYVYNHVNKNNDGINIDGCRKFVLSNSVIDSDDDGIVLKSTGAKGSEDVVITNCIVSSFCHAIKLGTETTGAFKNVTISNCIIRPSNAKEMIYGTRRGINGIALEIVDGGSIDGIVINNIVIEGTDCPLFIRLGNRARKHMPGAPTPNVGSIKNITINNLIAHNTGNNSSSIMGIPGYYIENINLSNVSFENQGGVTSNKYIGKLQNISEDEKGHPLPTLWGDLPSSALFIRHAKNISINGITLSSKRSDIRTPVIAVDVVGVQIRGVSKINSSSKLFFEGWNSSCISVEKPLGWEGEHVKIYN